MAVATVAAAASDSFETGTTTALPWHRDPPDGWRVEAGDAAEGAYAARTAPLADGATAILEVTLEIETTGEVSFWLTTSTESDRDELVFWIVGSSGQAYEKGRWSGERPWEQVAYRVSAGVWTFRWGYVKDAAGASGADRVGLDAVDFPPFSAAPTVTATATQSPTRTATRTPTATPTETATATATATEAPTEPSSPTANPSASPSPSPAASPTATGTPEPTQAPSPTATPTLVGVSCPPDALIAPDERNAGGSASPTGVPALALRLAAAARRAIGLDWDGYEEAGFVAYEVRMHRGWIVPVAKGGAGATLLSLGMSAALGAAARPRRRRLQALAMAVAGAALATRAAADFLEDVLLARIEDRAVTSFTDTGVVPGSSYEYVVVLVTADGAGGETRAESNVVAARAADTVEVWNIDLDLKVESVAQPLPWLSELKLDGTVRRHGAWNVQIYDGSPAWHKHEDGGDWLRVTTEPAHFTYELDGDKVAAVTTPEDGRIYKVWFYPGKPVRFVAHLDRDRADGIRGVAEPELPFDLASGALTVLRMQERDGSRRHGCYTFADLPQGAGFGAELEADRSIPGFSG
ncbi:MAG: hypothetical protein HYV63_03485, partial [Candidatus Schekmanbacteria bacterium]|nr:hypothetical protein [Candidatus Schekmanbacteria bacterium]